MSHCATLALLRVATRLAESVMCACKSYSGLHSKGGGTPLSHPTLGPGRTQCDNSECGSAKHRVRRKEGVVHSSLPAAATAEVM